MTLRFQSFVDNKIEARLIPVWAGTQIKKVEVSKVEKIWKLYLLLPQPIPNTILRETELQLKSYHDFLNKVVLLPE
jgi:hypothetical protein